MIRRATEEDIGDLLNMAEEFIGESGLPYTYDVKASYDTFMQHLLHHEAIVLIAEHSGAKAGFLTGVMDKEFTVEYSAYITKFYIRPEYRATGIAREMVEMFDVVTNEAVVTYAAATAKMGERVEKLFVNLFRKFGYNVLGRTLVKYNVKV